MMIILPYFFLLICDSGFETVRLVLYCFFLCILFRREIFGVSWGEEVCGREGMVLRDLLCLDEKVL